MAKQKKHISFVAPHHQQLHCTAHLCPCICQFYVHHMNSTCICQFLMGAFSTASQTFSVHARLSLHPSIVASEPMQPSERLPGHPRSVEVHSGMRIFLGMLRASHPISFAALCATWGSMCLFFAARRAIRVCVCVFTALRAIFGSISKSRSAPSAISPPLEGPGGSRHYIRNVIFIDVFVIICTIPSLYEISNAHFKHTFQSLPLDVYLTILRSRRLYSIAPARGADV